MSTPVFITGIGIVSPAGRDTEENWRALVGGRRCIRLLEDRLLTGGGAACGGIVEGFESPAGAETHDRVCRLAAAAADEATRAADLAGRTRPPADPDRLAVSFGTSKGGILSFGPAVERLREPRTSRQFLQPVPTPTKNYFYKEGLVSLTESTSGTKNYLFCDDMPSTHLLTLLADIPPDAPARQLARRFGARAGAHATVAACATGTLAVIRGAQAIADGQADVVVAGSSDASLHPLWFAAFRRMGVLAEAADPVAAAGACRPFDADRAGFAIAEGAAAMVLESAESLRRRGAEPLARISGWATGSDPAGLAQLRPDGAPLAEIVKIACRRACVEPAGIAAIQAHGTGTLANDAVEINAIRTACGPGVEIPVVSIKGAVGHLLGAAGAVELAVAALAASRRRFPPNATLATPDPAFDGMRLPREAFSLGARPILKLSMGFGGHLAAVLIDSV